LPSQQINKTSLPPPNSSIGGKKPQSVNDSLGALFAGGIPRKPSDVKSQKSTSSGSILGTSTASSNSTIYEEKQTLGPAKAASGESVASTKSAPNFNNQTSNTLAELKKRFKTYLNTINNLIIEMGRSQFRLHLCRLHCLQKSIINQKWTLAKLLNKFQPPSRHNFKHCVQPKLSHRKGPAQSIFGEVEAKK
jgi:hypothetical protein